MPEGDNDRQAPGALVQTGARTRDEALHNGYLLLRKPSPESKTHDLRTPKQVLYYGFVKPREA